MSKYQEYTIVKCPECGKNYKKYEYASSPPRCDDCNYAEATRIQIEIETRGKQKDSA